MSEFKLKIFGSIFIIITFVFVFFPYKIKAQTFSLGLWPPLLEIMIQPGRTVTQIYKLSNLGEEVTLVAKILPFEPSGKQGNINILDIPQILNPLVFSFEDEQTSLGKPFVLKQGQSKDLVLKIFVPKNTAEKDFYASLVFETIPTRKTDTSQTTTSVKIASNILITVSLDGQPQKRGRILEFSAPKIIDSFDPIYFKLEIENFGQTFFKPFGNVFVEGILNQKTVLKIQPDNVLAGFSRIMNIPPWKEKFLMGPFQAKAELTIDEEGEKLTSSTNFLVIPYKAILALITIFLVLITFINLPKKIKK